MPDQSPGKSKARGGKKTVRKTGSKAKGQTGTKTKPGGGSAPKAKRASKAKAPPKAKPAPKSRPRAASGKKKRTSRGKKTTLKARLRPYALGLALGAILGAVGLLVILYHPLVKGLGADFGPRPTSNPAARKDAPPLSGKTEVLYEENQVIERLIKSIDLRLYNALSRMKVPEEDVRFIELTSRTSGPDHWDHALIQVVLPDGIGVKEAGERLRSALSRIEDKPRPRLSLTEQGGWMTAEVYADGRHTHTIRLIPAALPHKPETAMIPTGPEPDRARPRAAIIIDDFGYALDQAECFLDLDMPVALSILPFMPHSREVALLAAEKGRPVMLHLPMEPSQWPEIDPGRGALLMNMGRDEVRAKVVAALQAVPNAVGVNNHMGSKFTEDRLRVDWVMNTLKQRGLFFVDSRTSTRSVAFDEARRIGLKAARRTIFLDNVQEPEAIRVQLRKLVAQARNNGPAVGIGHVYPVTCQVLKSEYNNLKSKIEIVPITSLMR